MTIILFIVGVLLVALGWHMGSRPASSADEFGFGDVGEGALAVFSIFLGGVFIAVACLAASYHWAHP